MKFFSTSNVYVPFSLERSDIPVVKHDSNLLKTHVAFTNKNIVDDACVQRDDVELIMANLGVFCHPEGLKVPEVMTSNDLFNIFEDEQPRLDEVKEAFDVFDQNKDGFIDASELQRILVVLGLKERSNIEDCRKMIRAFDENADGRIDFDEFVKFMEATFC
nr:probable calcium-binding protein CML45 [Tanacetum cinerariifolium]